jgi:hypothetical protein
VESFSYCPGNVVGLGDQEAVFCDRQRDPDDVGFLEAVGADQVGWHLPGDGDHGHRVHVRVGERGDQVGRARSRCGDADPGSAGRLGIAGGGMTGALLVPDQDVAHTAGVEQRVIGREDGPAGNAEDDVDAELFQRRYQRLGARHHHRLSVRRFVAAPPLAQRRCCFSALRARRDVARRRQSAMRSDSLGSMVKGEILLGAYVPVRLDRRRNEQANAAGAAGRLLSTAQQ